MKYKFTTLLIILIACSGWCGAQRLSFKDSINAYDLQRISTNIRGMKALGAWGLTSIAAGGIGYFAADNDETRYFSEMNVLWGLVNTGIAAAGFARVRHELKARPNAENAYRRYKADKRLYLINAGLDVLYVGAGIGLNEYGLNTKTDADIYKGFGKSVAIQGTFLLIFDYIMYSSHLRQNSKWFQLMNEIRFTGQGVGFVHQF